MLFASVSRTARLWCAVFLLPYVLLSGVLYGVRYSTGLQELVQYLTWLLWLAGPAANLVVDLRDSLMPYLAGSVIVLAASFPAMHLGRQGEPGAIACGTVALAAWLFFGVLVYLPLF